MLCGARSALAVIETLTPLSQFQRDSDVILLTRCERIDLTAGRATLGVLEVLKGDSKLTRLPILLSNNGVVNDAAEALVNVEAQNEVLVFITHRAHDDLAYGYCDGSWFLLTGIHDGDLVKWKYEHGEPYLRRSYSDETTKLVEHLRASVAGSAGLPKPDASIEKGYDLLPGRHDILEDLAAAENRPDEVATQVVAVQTQLPAFLLPLAFTLCSMALAWMATRSAPIDDAHA